MAEILVTTGCFHRDLLEVVVVGEAGLYASLNHLEVGLSERLGYASLGIDLLHLSVDHGRLEQASVQERKPHLSLE